MKTSNLQIIESLSQFLEKAMNQKAKYCHRIEDFSRSRLLSFSSVVYFILNLSKRSLSLELHDFFERLYPNNQLVTKSAFSQARYKLLPVLFQDWNAVLIQQAEYHQLFECNWLGFQLIGIDGTTIKLPDTVCIHQEFGSRNNQNTNANYSMAQVLCAYDVLNRICIQSAIAPISSSEPALAIDFVKQLPNHSLSIYDRGFSSFSFMYRLSLEQKAFLVRCKADFNVMVRGFVKGRKMSKVVDFVATDHAIKSLKKEGICISKTTKIKVRLVKVILDTGEVEVLMSSLIDDKQYPTRYFKQLYFYRWGVEVFFDQLKNIVQVENFTGHKPMAIYQEFYAMIFLSNLHALLLIEVEEELQEANRSRKYTHKINNNIAIGLMKYTIIELLRDQGISAWIELTQKILKHTEAVRPNRKSPRKKGRGHRGKFKTLTNYRRVV